MKNVWESQSEQRSSTAQHAVNLKLEAKQTAKEGEWGKWVCSLIRMMVEKKSHWVNYGKQYFCWEGGASDWN